MKLSDAIRLGAMLKPQGFGMALNETRTHTCAFGAALDALGELDRLTQPAAADTIDVEEIWPWLRTLPNKCPACGERAVVPAAIIAAHLNDDHRWTREQIADWVATVEPADPDPVAAPAPCATVSA